MRLLLVPAVIVAGLRLLAQTSAPMPDKTDEHPVPTCIVSGRVVTASEGRPLKSARVALVPERSASRRQIYATTSDSDGRFLLKDVAQGRYEFFATRPGFVDQHYRAKGDQRGATLSLKPGEKVSDVLFRMTVAAVITGRVTNEEGEPMIRVQAIALRAPTEEEIEDEAVFTSRKQQLRAVGSAQTDDRGQYRIFGLKPGEYYVQVTDSFRGDSFGMVDENYQVRDFVGSEYASAYYPGVSQVVQAQSVFVKPGDETQADVVIHRVKTVDVAGQVVGPNGPTRDAWVHMQSQGDEYGLEFQDTTDEKGNFRLKGIPPGSYVIMVFQQPEGDRVYQARARQRVEVNGDNIDSLTLSVGRGMNVHGRVLVAGSGSLTFDRIMVSLRPTDEDEQLGTEARVKKDGTFEITDVQDGNYAVEVWGLKDNWFAKSVRLGAIDILAEGLQLEKGASGGTLEITLSTASAQLEGSVSNDDGAVIGARVRIVPDPETAYNRFRRHSTRTDQTGHFSLDGLPPGKYRVFARSPVSPEGSSYKSEPKVVTVSENDHKTLSVKLIKPQD